MGLTTAGRNHIANAIIGGAVTAFDNSNAYIGVGNSNTAFAVGQTDLQGGSKFRQAMEATYPSLATNVITFQSIFGSSDANFAWEEWGIFNASSGGTMLSRLVESNGTKSSGQIWVMEVDITVSIGS